MDESNAEFVEVTVPELPLNPDGLRFIPLGGIGEIGRNMFAYEYGGEIVVIDCGLMFPEQEMLGIDLVIPDISYLLHNAAHVQGIVITHGHEDHVGALPWVLNELPVPVYGSKLSLGLIRNKLSEHTYLPAVELKEVNSESVLHLGPFTLTFFTVTHSIPDALGIIIDCPAGRVVHTGDFKLDQTPLMGQRTEVHKLVQAAASGVLALMSDVTNVERPGWVPSERLVAASFDELFAGAQEGRVIVACFASNIARIQEVLNVSARYGRRVCVIGRSMRGNLEVARALGFVHLPDPDILIEPDQVKTLPVNAVTVLTTGSQGEPLSALRLMSAGEHKYIKLSPGDLVVISATPIPGNEDLVYRTINQLFRQGAEVVSHGHELVHVSGHGNEEELKMMLTLTAPKYLVPMHGEYRHLVHYRKMAASIGYPMDKVFLLHPGDVLEFTSDGAAVIGQVPAGRVMIDGLGVGDIGSVVLRDRKHLSQDGILIAVAGIDSQSGEIISGPDIITRGFVYAEKSEELIEDAKEVVRKTVRELTVTSSTDWESVKTTVRTALNRFVNERTRRRPIVIPVIIEL